MGKGKEIPEQDLTVPGSQISAQSAHQDGKVPIHMHRQPLTFWHWNLAFKF
jgi:hypothetical protein